MKKRSAMTIAGGLVAALLAGAVALSLGFANGGPATTTAASTPREPRVRTIERTIKVHRKSKHTPAPIVRTIPAPAAPAPAPAAPAAPNRPSRHDRPAAEPSPSPTMSDGDDESDDESGDDDEHGEDHEDEGEGDGGFDD